MFVTQSASKNVEFCTQPRVDPTCRSLLPVMSPSGRPRPLNSGHFLLPVPNSVPVQSRCPLQVRPARPFASFLLLSSSLFHQNFWLYHALKESPIRKWLKFSLSHTLPNRSQLCSA